MLQTENLYPASVPCPSPSPWWLCLCVWLFWVHTRASSCRICHLVFDLLILDWGFLLSSFQVFQVAYIIIKAANAPRPGNWILERSVDGIKFKPWQYYAVSDTECLTRYKITPRRGPPTYRADNEVICTSYYSKLVPLEHGEVMCPPQKRLFVIRDPTSNVNMISIMRAYVEHSKSIISPNPKVCMQVPRHLKAPWCGLFYLVDFFLACMQFP